MKKSLTILMLTITTLSIFAQPPCKEDIERLKNSFHLEKDRLHNWYHTEKDMLHSDYEKTKYELKREWERIKNEDISEGEKKELEQSFEKNKKRLEKDFEQVKNDLEFDFQSRKKDLEIVFESDKRNLEIDCDSWQSQKNRDLNNENRGRKPSWTGKDREKDSGYNDNNDSGEEEGKLERLEKDIEYEKTKQQDKNKGRTPRDEMQDYDSATEHYDNKNWDSNTLPRDVFESLNTDSSNSYEKVFNKVNATWYKAKGPEIQVLHRYAPVGTAVKIINSSNDAIIYAKVVGKTSIEAEKREIIMQLSTNAMKLLKIYDDNFLVDCVYFVEDVLGK